MKKAKISILLFAALFSVSAFAGNEDRAGEAGASQLLINPWTRSVGFAGANTSSVTGLEAMGLNIAGMAYTRKTELLVNHKRYFVGSDINLIVLVLLKKLVKQGLLVFLLCL